MCQKLCLIVCVFVCFSFSLQAKWSEPVLLGELNDYVIHKPAVTPRLSADETVICYSIDSYTLHEAKLDPVSGLYSTNRVVSELGDSGNGIYSHWISQDGLKLYYAHVVWLNNKFQRVIKYAERPSTSALWQYKKTFTELHKDIIDTNVALTGDELTIIWNSMPLSYNGIVYQAVRPSKDKPFGGIRPLTELSSFKIWECYLSADGLILYFEVVNQNQFYELWKADRPALDKPFGNFVRLDEINQYGDHTRTPCVSPDQKTRWFSQRQGQPGDLTRAGIFVSRYIEEPYEKAMRLLDEAYEQKQAAIEQIAVALETEKQALYALAELQTVGPMPDFVSPLDILKARMSLLQAMHKQILSRFHLQKSVSNLQGAIKALEPDDAPSVPPAEKPKMTGQGAIKIKY